VISLERLPTVSLVHIVTQWSGSGGTEAYLSGQLASFSALTLLVGSSDPTIVPEMTYKVSSGTLNLCSLTLHTQDTAGSPYETTGRPRALQQTFNHI